MKWGVLSEAQLRHALDEQKQRGGILGRRLVDMNFVGPERMADALNRFHMRRRLSVDHIRIDPEILELVPRELVWTWTALPLDLDEDELVVAVPDASVSECIAALSDATGMTVQPVTCPGEEIKRALLRHYGALEKRIGRWLLGTRPYAKFKFETYVVGATNRRVYEVAMSVALSPGGRYNPLFIYGEVGHGKTHLLNAIGNRVLQERADNRVVYLPAVRFADELLRAVEQNKMDEFRMAYLAIDVLLLDDVQFLADQPAVQEEFANLFEAMQAGGRQIVVTSDRPPREVETLADRVSSGFGAGLVIGLESPSLAMKTAILMEKRREHNWRIPDHVIAKVAREFDGDVRRLEGILRTFSAKMELDSHITVDELASSVLSVVQSDEVTGDLWKSSPAGGT